MAVSWGVSGIQQKACFALFLKKAGCNRTEGSVLLLLGVPEPLVRSTLIPPKSQICHPRSRAFCFGHFPSELLIPFGLSI